MVSIPLKKEGFEIKGTLHSHSPGHLVLRFIPKSWSIPGTLKITFRYQY